MAQRINSGMLIVGFRLEFKQAVPKLNKTHLGTSPTKSFHSYTSKSCEDDDNINGTNIQNKGITG